MAERPGSVNENSRNLSQHHHVSKESSHYDNKSTTIIIHDKDIGTDNLHISVYKKRKDRSVTNEPSGERPRKFSARNQGEAKSSERLGDKIEFATITKNSPFQKVYQNDGRAGSKRRRVRSKKHHTGSEILLKENHADTLPDKNVSMEVTKHRSIAELYKAANPKAIHYKKKSLQYAMKRSRINDLLK